MRGTRAKSIAKLAAAMCRAKNINLGDGCGQYQQANNCNALERVHVPELGTYMVKAVKHPGTIFHMWKYKQMYRYLKRLYKFQVRTSQR